MRTVICNKLASQDPLINPFVPNAPFLYPLKTSGNQKVFWYSEGVEKVCMGTNGLSQFHMSFFMPWFFKWKSNQNLSNLFEMSITTNTSARIQNAFFLYVITLYVIVSYHYFLDWLWQLRNCTAYKRYVIFHLAFVV